MMALKWWILLYCTPGILGSVYAMYSLRDQRTFNVVGIPRTIIALPFAILERILEKSALVLDFILEHFDSRGFRIEICNPFYRKNKCCQ